MFWLAVAVLVLGWSWILVQMTYTVLVLALPPFLPSSHLYHPDGSLYMERFWLWRSKRFALRIHHIVTPDEDRHLHDHPWNFASLVMFGGYEEVRPVHPDVWCFAADGSMKEATHAAWRGPSSLAFRRFSDRHKITKVRKDTWTLCFLGPRRQTWGFYTPGGKIPHMEYSASLVQRFDLGRVKL